MRCGLTAVTIHIHCKVLAVLPSNRRVTIDEVTNYLQVSHGSMRGGIRTDQAFVRIVPEGSQANQRRAQVQYLDIHQHLLN